MQSRSKLLGNGQANFNKLILTSINYFRVTFEPVTFARCAFIIALRNIALDGYLDTRRNIILEHLRHDVRPEIYYIEKSVPLNRLESSLRSQ